jgi:Mg2+ and Co2+ transporter CorA
MDNVVGYNRRGAISNASMGSGGGGGVVDDILKRLGNVEGHVSELRSQVSAILAVIPHLATKADIGELRSATKTDIGDLKAMIVQGKADMSAMETRIIKWIVATVLASATLAFSIAKFVH